MTIVQDLKTLPFLSDLKSEGGSIFKVGGAVRDFFLGKDSKDLDLLVTGIPMDQLEFLLSKHGRVDSVGKSFGVLKFKIFGETDDIDIAIPRTEKKIGDGHKGFEVTYDHTLSIEKDLYRRDCTINSMAIDVDGNLIDPFGGLDDIKNKKIRLTNSEACSDDPLRMLRFIQQSSRFDFEIEEETFNSIKKNAYRIKEISGERIFIELEKIVTKGNKQKGLQLLIETCLFDVVFGKSFQGDISLVNKAQDMPEFVYLMLKDIFKYPADVYKNILKGDVFGEKKIEALTLTCEKMESDYAARMLVYKMNKISPISIESLVLSDFLKDIILSMKMGEFPLTMKDIAINGDDLLTMGYKGKKIGQILTDILITIYKQDIKNKKEDILQYINNEYYQKDN